MSSKNKKSKTIKKSLSTLLPKRADEEFSTENKLDGISISTEMRSPPTNEADDNPNLTLSLPDDNINQLEEQGILILSDEVSRDNINTLINGFLKKDHDPNFNGDILLMLNTEGGNLSDAWALIDIMESTSLPITTVGMGTVCSAGTLILAAGDPGCRFVMPRAEIMTHTLHSGAIGNIHAMKAYMHGVDLEHQRQIKFWASHSNYKTKKEIEDKLLRTTDVYMTPRQALHHGIIDGIVVNQRIKKYRKWLKLRETISKQKKK